VKTVAKEGELSELFNKFNAVPFDDRVNRDATISDIRRGYVEDFLRESNSSLVEVLNSRRIEELLVAMEVANVTDAGIDIRNIGIMMFGEHPEKFLPGTQIELIRFHSADAEASDNFTEKIFKGPLFKQIRDSLSYIQTNIIEEKVIKVTNKAKANRYYNYPYNSLEEALVNAVFHKSYQEHEPVEIRIYIDCIKIINYPGPAKWIDMDKFKEGKVLARKYRNRRIGEFLKEIDLSEKKSTGISKILRELRINGSPEPEFETDDERNYLITTIKMHKAFERNSNRKEKSKNERSLSEVLSEKDFKKLVPLIEYLELHTNITPEEGRMLTRKSAATVRRYLKILCDLKIIELEGNTNKVTYHRVM